MEDIDISKLNQDIGPPDKYYVYLWFRVSDNHIFYVGKGVKDRVTRTSPTHRNRYFINYIKKYQCDWRIYQNSLEESQAYKIENEIYQHYKKQNCCECNISDTSCCNGGSGLAGPLNGMYGKHHTPEAREKCRQANLDGRNAGENNSQFHVSPKDRMTEEVYNEWRKKQRSRKNGSTNPNAHSVYMINVETKQYQMFLTITDCCIYLLNSDPLLANRYDTVERMRYMIKHSNKTNAVYNNHIFKISTKKNPIDIDNTVSSLEIRQIRKIPKYKK